MSHCRSVRRAALFLLLILLLAAGLPAYAGTGFSEDPDAIEQAAQSVLKLSVYDSDRQLIATGSGFILFDNRTLVTNYHVIEDAVYVEAESDDGYEYTVSRLLISDKKKDLAILHLKTPTVMQPLSLETDMGSIKRGSTCVAIGSPKGITNTVSIGNVSAVYSESGVSYVQFTAPVSPGSSGGALFSDSGKVIGITTAVYNDVYAQNINFAVSAEEIRALYSVWDGTEHALGQGNDGGISSSPATDDGAAGSDEEITIDVLLLPALQGTAAECFASAQNRTFFAALAIVDWIVKGESTDRFTCDFSGQVYVGKENNVLGAAFPVTENSSDNTWYTIFLYVPGSDSAMYSIIEMESKPMKSLMEAVFNDGVYAVSSSSLFDTMNDILEAVNEYL